jgi:hypothetical protein
MGCDVQSDLPRDPDCRKHTDLFARLSPAVLRERRDHTAPERAATGSYRRYTLYVRDLSS